ncbi:MAG TPA: MFS transporter [Sphingomicrobium sp.]|nr:MFS transporter [Sphingomicrobium sp.]
MTTQPMRKNARILAASIVGTAVEYYDFYLYGYAAALVFGPLFFPVKSPAAQTLLAFMSFGIAFVARPIGAIVFGHFGDRIGRKTTLVASLLLMGSCTLAIAFLPTYAMAGWLAPLLLCLARFGQGFGLGGEWAGAALLSVEYAPKGWDCRFGMMPALGAALGNIIATAVFLLTGMILSEGQFLTWGWRIPFLASAILIAIGLWVRLKIAETPEFREALDNEQPPRVPILRLFAEQPWAVLAGAASVVCGFALVYMAGPFALAQGTGLIGYHRDSFLLVQLAALVCALPLIIIFAFGSDRTTKTRYFSRAMLAVVPIGLALGPGLGSGSLWIAGVTLFALDACWAVINGSSSAWLCRLYPVRLRYSGFAFAFNTGGLIGGAVIPIVAQMLSSAGGLAYVGLILSGTGLLSFAAIAHTQRSSHGTPPAVPEPAPAT